MKAWRILLEQQLLFQEFLSLKDSSSVNDDDFEDSQETTSNEDQLDDFIDGIF